MALEAESKAYADALPSLLVDQEGKFVLVHGTEVTGSYDTYADAIKAGYERYQLRPFLVKQVRPVEQVQFITRAVDPCLT